MGGTAVVPNAIAPSITTPQITMPNENRGSITNADPNSEGKAMLNNVSQAEPVITANQQQPMASNAMVAPPAPIMGGVVPTNDYMNGPSLRDKIAKYAMASFA